MPLSKEEFASLLTKAKKGDVESKEIIVKNYQNLVYSLVHRYKNSYASKDDLIQIGMIGLLKALEKFDLSYDVNFSTYAVPLILGEIKKSFRDEGLIKISRKYKELNIKINKFKNEFLLNNGKEPSLKEISKGLQINEEEIVLALDSSYYPTSLNEIIYEKNDSFLCVNDRLGEDNNEKILDLITLKEALEKLDAKERLLIHLRYYQNLKQDEVSKRFNVSQVQISRLEKKIIEKLRKSFV